MAPSSSSPQSAAPLSPSELDADHGYELASVSAVMIALQLGAVTLRFYARRITKAPLAADDWLIIPAMVTGIALCCVGIAGVAVGHMGRRTAWVAQHDPASLASPLKFLFVIEVLQIPFPLTLAKLSVLCFLRRLFPLPATRTATAVVGAVVAAHGLSTLLIAVFQCEPVPRAWDPALPGRCIDQLAWARYISVPNILTDVALLLLPLPVIAGMQTSVAKRVGLALIFAMGSFNIVASAIRMSFFFTNEFSADPFWMANKLHVWCILESSTAVIAACMPSMWPVIKHAFGPTVALAGSWTRGLRKMSSGSSPSERLREESHSRGSAERLPQSSSSCEKHAADKVRACEVAGPSGGASSAKPLVRSNVIDVEQGWPHHQSPPALRYC